MERKNRTIISSTVCEAQKYLIFFRTLLYLTVSFSSDQTKKCRFRWMNCQRKIHLKKNNNNINKWLTIHQYISVFRGTLTFRKIEFYFVVVSVSSRFFTLWFAFIAQLINRNVYILAILISIFCILFICHFPLLWITMRDPLKIKLW